MRKISLFRGPLLKSNLLSTLIVVLLGIEIVFSIVQGGWLSPVPRIEEEANNTYTETLRVVADMDFAPYSSIQANGSYIGHDIECMNIIANRMGVNIDLELMTWTKAIQEIKSGKADVIMGLESMSNRQDGLMITSVIAEDNFVVYGKETIHSIADLKSSRMATIAGKTEVDIYGIEENALVYDTYSEELDALERGEVDYGVFRASVVEMLIQRKGYKDLIQVFDMMDSGLGLGVAEGNASLANRLDLAIGELKGDGSLQRLQKKWLTTYVSRLSLIQLLRTYRSFYLLINFCIIMCMVGMGILLQREQTKEREQQARIELGLKEVRLARQEAELAHKEAEIAHREVEIAYKEAKIARMDAEIARKDAELADSRARIMLSQIRPHFLYNVLGTIGQLCRKDSEDTADAIDTFARYLRSNLASVETTGLIPFVQELQHVKTYIWLEQLRFGEDLLVEYEIGCENFQLPPLSLQPLVENAVKHGLGQKEEGGTVKIRTVEKEECWEVCVEDDGVDFDVASVKNDGRLHIGVDNVRYRLESMCNGSLFIESKIGTGTRATIQIPKSVTE